MLRRLGDAEPVQFRRELGPPFRRRAGAALGHCLVESLLRKPGAPLHREHEIAQLLGELVAVRSILEGGEGDQTVAAQLLRPAELAVVLYY